MSNVALNGHGYTVVELDTALHAVDLFTRPGGVTLQQLQDTLRADGKRPAVAMNAGMYVDEVVYAPVGLAVTSGVTVGPLNTQRAPGNFFLKPNGVFYLDDSGPHVVTTGQYSRNPPANPSVATQSGPMLVLPPGRIHPAFARESTNLHVRNGVGVRGQEVVWVISNQEVNLHELASVFLDILHCQSALYLDGTVSAMTTETGDHGAVTRRWGGLLFVAVPRSRADSSGTL